MGVLRFVVEDAQRITDLFLGQLYVASLEGIPWRCFAERTDEGFQVRRRIDESGCLYAMWPVSAGGELLLSTASLMERERPYLLAVELARGTLNRLRNQTAAWRQGGLVIPAEVMRQISAAAAAFAVAATHQHDVAAATTAAQDALGESLRGCQLLLETYVEQVGDAQPPAQPVRMFGAQMSRPPADASHSSLIAATFSMAGVETCWADCEPVTGDFDCLAVEETVDWAKGQRLKTMLGPLLDFESASLPDWLVLWEDDFDTLQAYAAAWVGELVERFSGEVALWHAAARINSGRVLSLTDEQRLKLVVTALESIRRRDAKTPILVSFDQPWAEYMGHTNTDVAPLHFADALARADLGLAGFGLHIDWGFRPGGTLPRNPLELSELLDQWSLLGLPLVVFLTMPSSLQDDPQASGKRAPLPGGASPHWDAQAQCELASKLAEVCWCKQSVQGVVWNQTFDAAAHRFPNAGLFDQNNEPKPIIESLRRFRGKYFT